MRYVLFVCTQNAGRSQMAEAFFTRIAPGDLRAESAGQLPAREVHRIPDPAGRTLGEVREIRDEIEGRVERLATEHLGDIRSDRTAHQHRACESRPHAGPRICGDPSSPEEIGACADAVLDRYDDALVRTHVLTFARRRAKDCLRAESCYELADA